MTSSQETGSNVASRFMRPALFGLINVGMAWLLATMPAEHKLTAFGYLLASALVLFFFRGVVDKGNLTEWLRIWKGRDNG
tara:strand:+ start:457 stop:696 length:240 start_codon:yes stop_codon:yes gene_type:complete